MTAEFVYIADNAKFTISGGATMTKTITIKGIGRVSAKPDYVELFMNILAKDKDYNKVMELAGSQIQLLKATLICIGFAGDSLKTTNFDVDLSYDSVKDKRGIIKEFWPVTKCGRSKARFRFRYGAAFPDAFFPCHLRC